MSEQRDDLQLIADAAASWADELDGYIAEASERYGDQESADEQCNQAEAIREALTRIYATLLDPRCSTFAVPSLRHRLGRCTKDAGHQDICMLEEITESENTK